MKISDGAGKPDRVIRRELRDLTDAELIAQELVQKGALHALETARATAHPIDALIASVEHVAQLISEECRRRELPTVDELEVS